MAQESSIEVHQQKGKLRLLIAKVLASLRIFYQGISWENIKAAIVTSVNNAVKLLWIAGCIAFVVFVVKDLSTDLVAIEPISVPKAFSENGYTPEVASHRLNDAINVYVKGSGSLMQAPNVAARDELPKFIIPKIDLSLDTIVASIRGLLHYGSRRTISGELIVRGKLAWLRLRVDGQEVHSSPRGFDIDSLDELFVTAIPDIMEKIRPYLIASALYESDPAKGAAKANEIISRLPETDVNVEWAYVLKGLFLTEQKNDYAQAESVLRKAIALNEANFAAHFNLGNALSEQNKSNEAITEFRRAIQIKPKDAGAHNNLGVILHAEGRLDEAITAFRRAIALGPTSRAHTNLGAALGEQGKLDEAIAEFGRAIEADPNSQQAKSNLEAALPKKGSPSR